jgi:hypothetical protein
MIADDEDDTHDAAEVSISVVMFVLMITEHIEDIAWHYIPKYLHCDEQSEESL